MKSAARG